MEEKSKYDIIGARHALNGIRCALRTEKNLKIDLVAGIAVLAVAYLLSVPKTEVILLIITIGIVISAELFNTAIEKVVDLICIDILKNQLQRDEYNAFAKLAKDMAAGAVLVTAIMAAAIGLIIFIPRIYALF